MPIKKTLFLLFFAIYTLSLKAQQKFGVQIETDEQGQAVLRNLNFPTSYDGELSARKSLGDLLITLHSQSYLAASIDSLNCDSLGCKARLFCGPKYRWVQLGKGNVPDEILSKLGFQERFYRNQHFSHGQYSRLEKGIIEYSENHGQPFAWIKLDSIHIENGGISGILRYNGGPLFFFDSIVVHGNARITGRFLSRYLRIQHGQPFSQLRVDESEKLMKQLPYVQLKQKPYMQFTKTKAGLHLSADHKHCNQIDAVIGFLPGQNNGGALGNGGTKNNLTITGEANLLLQNLFNSGKTFKGEWRQFKNGSPLLNLEYTHPHLFGTPIEAVATLNLLKDDTNFINIKRQLSLAYRMIGTSKVNFLVGLSTTDLIATGRYKYYTTLPPMNPSSYTYYGIGYNWTSLDDFFSPKKGYRINVVFSVGNREIRKTPNLDSALYNGLTLKTSEITWQFTAEKFSRMSGKTILYTRINSQAIYAQNLFLNELNRLGGFKTLRGFNENIFFANRYVVNTVELRQYTDADSYVFLFCDQGYYVLDIPGRFEEQFPIGFGAGVSFTTPGGIFNLAYSLGKSAALGQELSFSQSKINFGFSSRF